MSFLQIIETQRLNVEDKISALLDRQHTTEQQRDVAPTPKERAALELQISEIRSLVESYKTELGALESELRQLEDTGDFPHLAAEARFPLDYDDSPTSSNDEFRNEVSTTLSLMGYDVEEHQLAGLDSAVLIASQEGDFEDVKGIFHCVPGTIDRQLVTIFNGLFLQLQNELTVRFASLITNSFIAPDARELEQTVSIQVLTFGQLLNKLINFTPYLRKTAEEYRSINPLFRTYVESKYLRTGSGKFEEGLIGDTESLVTQGEDTFVAKGDLSTYINTWLRSPTTEHICLLGDYGTGKTSFATHFFYQQATKFLNDPVRERLPILISLSRYHTSADIVQMVTDFLANECSIKRNANMRAFLKMAEAGKLVVILDGFDEMAQQVDRNVRKRNFAEIARILVGRNKVLVLGRPNYFLEEAEIAELLGQEPDDADPYRAALQLVTSDALPRYEILNLALFDRWQIEEFLKHQAEFLKQQGISDWRELQNTIYDTYNLEELARTPVLLEIIIKTVSEIKKTVTDINAAKLYEIYTGFWLDREYDEKGEVRWLINRSEKEFFCLELAWQMLSRGSSEPSIHYRDLSEKVRTHFNLEKASEIEYFSSDIRFCSFLVHSEADGTYKFIHKSFMEYFAARYIFHALVVDAKPSRISSDSLIYEEVCFFLEQLVTESQLRNVVELARSTTEGFVAKVSIKLLQRTSESAERRGDIHSAITWAVETQKLCGDLGNMPARLDATVLEGRLHSILGELEQAKSVLESAADLATELDDPSRFAGVLLRLGDVSTRTGNYNDALQSYEQALDCLSRSGSRELRPEVLNAIARIRRAMGQPDDAVQCFEEALAINREVGNIYLEAVTLMELGNSYSILGRSDEAIAYFEQSRRMFMEMGDRKNEGIISKCMSEVHVSLGRFAEAEQLLVQSLEIADRLNNRTELADSIYRLGMLKVNQGDFDQAQEMFEKALPVSRELGDLRGYAEVRSSLGRVCFSRGAVQEAEEHYRDALYHFERMGDVRNVAITNQRLGDLASQLRDIELSRNMYSRAIEGFLQMGDQRNLFHSLVALGKLERHADHLEEAKGVLDRAREIAESLRNPHDTYRLHEEYGQLLEQSGDAGEARREFQKCEELAQKGGFEQSNIVRDALSKTASLHREINPFEYSQPQRIDTPLVGRRDVLAQLKHAIEARQSVLFTGERGMGKTSLLRHLLQSMEEPWVAVYTYGQNLMHGGTEALNSILSDIVESLSKARLISPSRMDRITLNYSRDFVRAIRSIIEEAHERKPDLQLLLIIDEAEILFHRDVTEIPSVLRQLVQSQEAISLVLSCATSARLLEIESQSPTSPFSNVLMPIHLGPFTISDTQEFVTRQSATIGLKFEQEVIHEVFRLSAGQPRLIQHICHVLTAKVQKHETSIVTMVLLDSSRQEIMEGVYMMIQHIIESLSKQQVEWLTCLSTDAALPKLPRNAIQELVERDIVRPRNGVFEIQSSLLKDHFSFY